MTSTTLKNYAKLFVLTFPVLIAFDMSWMVIIAGDLYRTLLDPILAPTLNPYFVFLYYLLYSTALLYFAVSPALRSSSFSTAFTRGAIFGITVSALYNFSNMATLALWSFGITLLDTAWNGIMCACVAGLVYLLATRLYDITAFGRAA